MDTIRAATEAGVQLMGRRTVSRFYIATRYGRKEEAASYAEALERRGYTVTSSWIHQPADEMYANDPKLAAEGAKKDLEEIRSSDAFVYLSEIENNPWGRGGRHVEFGYAMALGIVICVVGPLENLFHYHPSITHFESFDDFIEFLREE